MQWLSLPRPPSLQTQIPAMVFFEPAISEFSPIPEAELKENEARWLTSIRKMFPDAVVAENEDKRRYVLSETASLAFEIPVSDSSSTFSQRGIASNPLECSWGMRSFYQGNRILRS